MAEDDFDLETWLRRIGYAGPRAPTLGTLAGLITAQSATIPFENFDVLLGKVPRLDIGSLQRKLVTGGRGGYCFEQNMVFRAGLRALGFHVTSLIARVIRDRPDDAPAPKTHMALRVEFPEGAYLADVGFGNLTPTAPLLMRTGLEQATPHETMRLMSLGDELLLQVKLDDAWQNIYRLSPRSPLDIDYDAANWFTATHPASPFVGNMIVARAGANGVRKTFFNGHVTVRHASGAVERRFLQDAAEYAPVLETEFGLLLSADDLAAGLAVQDTKGTRGTMHPAFG